MTSAQATIETARYVTTIEMNRHSLLADEPQANGGGDRGPGPYDLLLASLGSCTAITLRMYADRKGWDLRKLTVDLRFSRNAAKDESVHRTLRPEGELTEEQRARLADIAERTPVTLTLKRGLAITTALAPPPHTETIAELDERLDEALDESFPASDPPSVTPEKN